MAITILCISIIFLSIGLACMRWELNKHYELIKLNHKMITNEIEIIGIFCKSLNAPKEFNEEIEKIIKEIKK